MFLGKVVLKICSKFTGEHPCWSVISIKLLCNFIEIALRHECSPLNLLHIFRTSFPRNAFRWLFLCSEKFYPIKSFAVFSKIYKNISYSSITQWELPPSAILFPPHFLTCIITQNDSFLMNPLSLCSFKSHKYDNCGKAP